MPYIPHTPAQTQEMLDIIGVKTLDDLFYEISEDMRPKSFDVGSGMTELELMSHMRDLSHKNKVDLISFLGGGFYNHYIPPTVDLITSRSEFYTAYTPYQAESSQGTLQAIFEFQSSVCRLFEMDCANASVYDGGSALFEGSMMAVRATGRNKLVVDGSLNPIWYRMLKDYAANLEIEFVHVEHVNGQSDINDFKKNIDENCAAVITQNPNFFGSIQDFTELFAYAKEKGAISIISVNPVMQSVLKTPGEMGADIAVADGQGIGLTLSFGGPYLGIMTCTKKMVRQLPGRIAGRTVDVDGKTAYVLTLQAREQHIRRAKATSNICSNQALCALRAVIHMALLGKEGMISTAEISMNMARYALENLLKIDGVKLLNDAPFGYEFAITLPKSAKEVVDALMDKKLLAGVALSKYYNGMDNALLIACTELTTKAQVDLLCKELRGAL